MSNLVKLSAYGVSIGIEAGRGIDPDSLVKRMTTVLPVGCTVLNASAKTDHHFAIRQAKRSGYDLYKADEKIVSETEEDRMLDSLDSQVRITVAEFAVGKVFVHSGVVALGGKAIMIPASSFKGKTTLTAELVKNGAVYFSDEYAVLDENGLVHPFPKTLSVREKEADGRQVEYPVERFGGVAGKEPLQVGMVLVTEYKKYSRWRPEILSRGQGVLEIISHTVPIRNNPAFSLSVLNKVVDTATVVKGDRGEVSRFAKNLISYFEENILER